MPESTAIEIAPSPASNATLSFGDASRFEHIQRVATMFSKSQLVPPLFQNNIPNCVIGLEIAQRIGASPMMVFQNLTSSTGSRRSARRS